MMTDNFTYVSDVVEAVYWLLDHPTAVTGEKLKMALQSAHVIYNIENHATVEHAIGHNGMADGVTSL